VVVGAGAAVKSTVAGRLPPNKLRALRGIPADQWIRCSISGRRPQCCRIGCSRSGGHQAGACPALLLSCCKTAVVDRLFGFFSIVC
jgi:hypothetical protein